MVVKKTNILWCPSAYYNKLLTMGQAYYGTYVSVITNCSIVGGFIMAPMSLLQQTAHYGSGLLWHLYLCYTNCSIVGGFIMAPMSLLQQTAH